MRIVNKPIAHSLLPTHITRGLIASEPIVPGTTVGDDDRLPQYSPILMSHNMNTALLLIKWLWVMDLHLAITGSVVAGGLR